MTTPRQYSLVKAVLAEEYEDQYPFANGDTFIFLGEIIQMPGHCVIAAKNGQVLFGYHTDNFVELTEDEA